MRAKRLNGLSRGASILAHLLFVLWCSACLLPFLTVLSVSLSDERMVIREGYALLPKVVSFSAYQFLFSDAGQIFRSYGISILVAGVGTVLSVLLIALYAYPLYRKDFPYRRFFAMFLFVTMLFNGGLVPFYILYTQYLGLRDNVLALILPYLLNPFYVIIMRTYFTQNIPDSIIESAKLDGASETTILFRIVFPVALPVFATVSLFVVMVYWNDWFMSLLFISKQSNVNIQYYMYRTMLNIQYMLSNAQVAAKVASTDIPSETTRMAMAIAGIGPIVFAYLFFQKYFVKGLTVGAVKG